jgi:hypothetical protein
MKSEAKLAGLMLSPLVVAARLPIVWLEAFNPDPRRRSETNRMVTEKVAAMQEGMVASQMALGTAMAEAAAAMMFGLQPKGTPHSVAESMINAGLAPAARRVKANHKRLGKR